MKRRLPRRILALVTAAHLLAQGRDLRTQSRGFLAGVGVLRVLTPPHQKLLHDAHEPVSHEPPSAKLGRQLRQVGGVGHGREANEGGQRADA